MNILFGLFGLLSHISQILFCDRRRCGCLRHLLLLLLLCSFFFFFPFASYMPFFLFLFLTPIFFHNLKIYIKKKSPFFLCSRHSSSLVVPAASLLHSPNQASITHAMHFFLLPGLHSLLSCI